MLVMVKLRVIGVTIEYWVTDEERSKLPIWNKAKLSKNLPRPNHGTW